MRPPRSTRPVRTAGPARSGRAVRPVRRPRPPLPEHFRRRRRIAAATLAALLAVVAAGIGGRALLYDAGLADVEGVEVTGATAAVTQPAVLTAAAVTRGVPLAGVDLVAVERRVEELPGVADAVVGRSWPHTVTIEVTERAPVAVADTSQGRYLVDRSGVAYLPAPDRARLPRLAVGVLEPGREATAQTRAALDVLATLPGTLRPELVAVEVTPEPAVQVTLRLTRGREIRWGSPDRAVDKAAVLGPLLSQSGIVYDVSSPELPTIRR